MRAAGVLVGLLVAAHNAVAGYARAPRPSAATVIREAGRAQAAEATIRATAVACGLPPEVLVAMWRVETGGRHPAPVGDQGRAFGPFQIHARLHGLSRAQCEDPAFATRWTCRRIQSFGDLWTGVQRHNGSGPAARQYARRVRAIAGRMTMCLHKHVRFDGWYRGERGQALSPAFTCLDCLSSGGVSLGRQAESVHDAQWTAAADWRARHAAVLSMAEAALAEFHAVASL